MSETGGRKLFPTLSFFSFFLVSLVADVFCERGEIGHRRSSTLRGGEEIIVKLLLSKGEKEREGEGEASEAWTASPFFFSAETSFRPIWQSPLSRAELAVVTPP